jgi:HSP20 family protein
MADKSTENESARAQSPAGAAAAQAASSQPSQTGAGTQSSTGGRDQQAGRGSGTLQRRSSMPSGTFALSPFMLMRRMMEDLDRMFEEFGSTRGAGGNLGDRGGLGMDWSPAVEMLERDGQLVIRADLPGLSPEDVRIEVSDDGLVIEGERRSEIEVEDEGGVYRSERTYGRFSRLIALPDDVDVSQAQARFDNGVLEIVIPLPEESQRRRIPIQGASGRDEQQPGATGPVH